MNSSANRLTTSQSINQEASKVSLDTTISDMSSGMPSSLPSDRISALVSQPKLGAWRWLLMSLLVCCSLGSVATLAFLWLTSLPPRINCDEISALSPDIDRLSCAQEAARSGEVSDLMTGLKLVESWTPEHPLHNEAQRWMEEWSKSVLIIARQKMADSDLEGAIELANRVPKSSPAYADAQAAITKWQDSWRVDQAIYARAEDALKQQDWQSVSQRILELSESPYPYWNAEKVNELSQRVLVEKKAQQTLAQSKQLAQFGTPQDLKAAIDRAKQMDTTTYTWSEAQPVLKQWGDTLLTIGFQHWRERRLLEAIDLAETVAVIPDLTPEAQNLLKLSQARQLAIASDTRWKAAPKHVWNLMEATAAARQIPADSRFYAQAQESLKSWEAQLKDTTQLQYAQVMADLGQRDLVQAAITQAESVSADRPRRLQAQTLIAHWQNEVERVEDRPYLLFARQVAEPGTIPALKSAIAEASKVQMGRVLRGEAQGLIYEWTQQIQAIEDRPFLTMARIQADQGNLTEAIRAAATIQPGRALYYEAQAAIGSWQTELNRIATARTRRETQRQQSTSTERHVDSSNNVDPLPPFQWNELPSTTDKTPKFEPQANPTPVPHLVPPQRARRVAPPVEPEVNSPFVLEENMPLFEEAAPATNRSYDDLDDIPRLINRRANRNTPAAPSSASPSTDQVFSAPPDSQLFEAEPNSIEAPSAPVEEVAPPVTNEPVFEVEPLVEELAPTPTESSSIEPATPETQSVLPEAEPLSFDRPDKDLSASIESIAEPTSLFVSETISTASAADEKPQ